MEEQVRRWLGMVLSAGMFVGALVIVTGVITVSL